MEMKMTADVPLGRSKEDIKASILYHSSSDTYTNKAIDSVLSDGL
jgi:hypothetical protein